jgi:seryl-tRNA synthetase
MHDLTYIRADPQGFDAGLARRALGGKAIEIVELDAVRRQLQVEVERLLQRRNEASREIGAVKSKGGDASSLLAEVSAIKAQLPELELRERETGEALDTLLSNIPNLPAADVPDGVDEGGNVEQRRFGEPIVQNSALEHFTLGENLGLMDFEAAAKLSGARFTVLRGQLAQLERAIGNFMIDLHTTEFGYAETGVPLLVRDAAVYGTGSLPKFAEDLFRTENGFWLIPTAEVSLTNLVADSILEEAQLPIRLTAWTPCFRSEAGSAGRDTRGMIRQHQFQKVELVSITHPDHSEEEHQRKVNAAETVLQRLELPFRTMMLCTGDMGFASRKTYDLEVWLPGQRAYREISSISNCGDFQARRMRARFRPADGKGTRFVHTLNGSGLAVGRTLVAILENYQQENGTVAIPTVLQPYMGGRKVIEKS